MMGKYIGEEPSQAINSSDHLSIRASLPEYAMLLVLNQEPPPVWRVLQQHVEQCTSCQRELDALTRLMAETYAGPLPETPLPPKPDLRFLHPDLAPPSVFLLPLTILVTFVPAERAWATKRGGIRGMIRYEYQVPKAHPTDPEITLQLYAANEQAELGLLRIMIEQDVDNPMDQPRLRVLIRMCDDMREAITDSLGIVSFDEVPLDALADLEITLAPPNP